MPAGQAKTIRVRNIAPGTVIAVRISASGRILVSLVGLKDIKKPRPESKPLFRGATQEKLSFRVTAPEADDYVLVLSNRDGAETVSVQAEIRALRGEKRDYEFRPSASSASS